MEEARKPFYRIVGGSGTHADPHQMRSDIERRVAHIYPRGNNCMPQIAAVRTLMAETDMSDELRARYDERLNLLEYQWRCGRASDLVHWAYTQYAPPDRVAQRRAQMLQQARDAREAFYAFAAEHPAIHEQRRGEVPAIDDLVAKEEANLRKK